MISGLNYFGFWAYIKTLHHIGMDENLEMPLYSVFYHGGCLYEPSLGLEAQYFIDRQWATTTCAPPSDDRNNQAVSCQAIFPTTGPHQLITSRNHVLTDGPMHIDRPALPRSKSPNANESFPIWERGGKSISLLLDIIPVLHRAHDVNVHKSQLR